MFNLVLLVVLLAQPEDTAIYHKYEPVGFEG